jgi:hypothetical protein
MVVSPYSNFAAIKNNRPVARVVNDRAGMPINLADGGPVKAKPKPKTMSKSQKSVAAKSRARKSKAKGKSC